MKTFTNYAEKKAKQILNLLQGYTKGIRITAILILLLMGVSNAWGGTNSTFYLAISQEKTINNNNQCNAQFNIQFGGGNNEWAGWTNMTKTDKTYNGKVLYEATYEFKYGGYHWWQFRMEENGNQHWYKEPYPSGSWNTDLHNNQIYDYENGTWVNYTYDDDRFVIVGNGMDGDNTWLKGKYWNNNTEDNIAQTTQTYSNCPAGLKVFRITNFNDWNQDHGFDQVTSCNVPYYTNEHNNVAFFTVAKANITIEFNGSNITVDVAYDQEDLTIVKKAILNGSKVMFYYGDEWGVSDCKYVNKNNTTTHLASEQKGFKVTINQDKFLAIANLPAATYSISNSDGWSGVSTNQVVEAGAIYACYNDGSNKIRKTNGILPRWTKDNATITKGEVSSGLTATVNNSSLGREQTITYYYTQDDGNTWKQFNPNDVSSLAAGTYTVRALAHDGNIYVRTEQAATLVISDDTYTVHIQAGPNGTVSPNTPQEVNATSGLDVSAEANPGYHFKNWTIPSGGGSFTNENAASTNFKPTEESTIQANFEANECTITWNANGGTVDPTSSTYIYDGDQVVLPTPKREGYTFNGWFTASSGGERINDVGKENKPTSNVTYYAHWAENLFPVTISASANGSVTPSGEQQIGIVERSVNATANTGYQFKNWTVTGGAKVADANSASTTVTATATGTVTANFTAITYTITYNLNNGTGTMNPTSYTVETETFNLPTPTRAGYTFAGWFENSNLTGVAVTQITKGSTGNKKFYAKWTEILSTITIEINPVEGGIVKVDGQEVTSGQTVEVGVETSKQITLQANTGYGIAAFKQEGAAIIAGTGTYTLKADGSGNPGKLIANFTKNSYTFTLVQAEGGNATATVNGKAISSPATLEHGTQITLNATAADKYKFSKWVNGNRTQVSTDNPYTHTLTANTTIQAVFTNTDVLYLKPNSNWTQSNAWFAAYFFKEGSSDNYWVKMKNENPCGGSDYYKVQIPKGDWTHVIFCRMDKDRSDLSWESRWDQSTNQTIPDDGKNCFSVNSGAWGGSEGASGAWSTYIASHYDPVVFNVTVPAGTPNCYIIGDWDGWSQFTEMTKVDDTHYTITIPDVCATSAKYKYCYGPSWGCQEVKSTSIPTEGISDRTYNSSDNVAAWISYYIVGYNNNWGYNNGYKFDINGNLYVHLATIKEHDFKIKSSMGEVYTTDSQDGEKHKFNRSHTSEYIPQTDASWHNLILKVDVAGYYDFTFNPVNKLLTIVFPSKGYRLKITMTDDSGKVYTSNEVNNETETLSFFAPGSEDSKLSANITLEYQGSQRATIPSTSFKTSGVYTAKLNSDKNGITDPTLYDGNYYIRTDGANGGWNSYKTNSDNKMTYFVPREEEKYSYYWVEALPRAARDHTNGVVNVKACVANEYNENLAVMLEADKFTDGYGNVTIKDPSDQKREKINVRFGYNPKTNHFERAMLTGSGNMPNFLNITDPEGFLYKTNNQGTLETPLTTPNSDNKFTDVSNWVYERDVWVDVQSNQDVTVRLTAVAYNEETNSLFGFEDADQEVPTQRTIVGKTSTQGPKKMRIIYDFKTNRMIMAWIPGEYNCTGEEALISDVLFMRHENDPVPQLTMTDTDDTDQITPQIKGIQTQFFALELENKGNQNYEEHYWITLPFNCIVGSISGVPGYMTVWGIQRYDGAERAQKGWFKETETFWKWLGPDDVMEAGVGYVLSFDKSAATWNTFDVHTEHDDGSVTTTQKSLLRLYFPSTEKGFTFKSTNSFEKEYPNEPCTIQREDRYKQDGNWKIIGPISYNTATADPEYKTGEVWKPEEDGDHVDVSGKWSQPMFRYKYTYDNSTANNRKTKWKYIPEDGEKSVYQAFYGYLVQFAGLIKWSEISQSIHPRLRARTYTDQVPTNITTHLELVDADGVQHDQTFVALNIEGTTTYDLNKDLNKAFNSNFANIYTLSEGIPFAGNTLPMEKVTVPVGVRTATAGEYTFRMPDGTNGITVTLVDNATGTHTNMLMDEYTVTLDAGTIENRFYLMVDPDRTATSVENVGEEAKGQIKKFLIDGKLFIRTADGIFDAKGQRL